MNFLFIKVMRRILTAQYAAEYDMFETVLFLETMATTFCRLRPEALHRHGLPLQLRLLPTTMELLDAVASLLCRRLCHDTRVHIKSQESCCLAPQRVRKRRLVNEVAVWLVVSSR
jgi:hypothetical protein